MLGVVLAKFSVERIRKNHGLEHATIQVIGERARTRLVGRSDRRGFSLYGDVPTEVIVDACDRAIQRLGSGERSLAVHPYCGTNFVIAGVLASVVSMLAILGSGYSWRARLARLPLLIIMITGVLILSQPLGMAIQRGVTTSYYMGDLEVVSIKRRRIGFFTVHRVETRG